MSSQTILLHHPRSLALPSHSSVRGRFPVPGLCIATPIINTIPDTLKHATLPRILQKRGILLLVHHRFFFRRRDVYAHGRVGSSEFGLDGGRVDSVGVETGSDCAGNGVVSFYSVDFGEVDANVHRGNHFDVGELPNMEFMHILHSVNLQDILLDIIY